MADADAVDGVDDGGMVAPTHAAADLGEAVVGELAREVHGDLAGGGHGGAPVAGHEGGSFDPELSGGRVEDVARSRRARRWAAPPRRPSTWRTSAGVGSCPRSEE